MSDFENKDAERKRGLFANEPRRELFGNEPKRELFGNEAKRAPFANEPSRELFGNEAKVDLSVIFKRAVSSAVAAFTHPLRLIMHAVHPEVK
ncbi:hypothetical protein GOL99_17760 [Sinorhizobium medicae]|nr:hypothetical protein [Sinorhizobium medicae]